MRPLSGDLVPITTNTDNRYRKGLLKGEDAFPKNRNERRYVSNRNVEEVEVSISAG